MGTLSGTNGTSRRKKPSQVKENSWLGFVDIPLTAEDKKIVKELDMSGERMEDFINEVTADGYKLSISEDSSHGCFVCTLTGRGAGNPNAGLSLTGRGPTVAGSMAALAYKHLQLCGGGSWGSILIGGTDAAWG